MATASKALAPKNGERVRTRSTRVFLKSSASIH